VRAAGIAFVVGVNFLAALQLPKITDRSLQSPDGVRELALWVDILGGLGVEIGPEELGQQAKAVVNGPRRLRAWLTKPFGTWFKITGTHQGWGLFAYPDAHPFKLRITVSNAPTMRGEEPTLLYMSHDSAHQWMGSLIHYRRFRGLYNPRGKKPAKWNSLTCHLASRALEDYPDLQLFRMEALRSETLLPWEGPRPPYRVVFGHTCNRRAAVEQAP
jgi:hypothetical protein